MLMYRVIKDIADALKLTNLKSLTPFTAASDTCLASRNQLL
jgi:hypothetical protein